MEIETRKGSVSSEKLKNLASGVFGKWRVSVRI